MRRVLAILVLITCVVPAGFTLDVRSELYAAESAAAQDYDYKSLAVASILSSAEEASKLPDIEQRVTLIIAAAKLLPASKRDDATRILDIALHDLKEWVADEKKGRARRYTAATLRSEVLVVYAKLDLEKATALQKEARPDNASTDDLTRFLRSDRKWPSEILARRGPADQAAKIALSIIDTDPERASALVVQSVVGGVVSGTIFEIFQKLGQSGKRPLLDKLEGAVSQVLASSSTLDQFSFSAASSAASDPDMPSAARSGFIRFLMNSLETWAMLVKGEDGNGGLDLSYVGSSFMMFFLNVRPVIAKYSPADLLRLDVLFEQVSAFVPEKTKSMLQAFQPETLSDPKDRLADILKEPNPEKRDLRLVRLVSELMDHTEGVDSQKELDLASEAISQFSDSGLKMTFADFLTITRLNSLVKLKKFIDAQRLAGSISSQETRAWAMLALAAAAKEDRVLAFELTSNALKVLDAASPSPEKVELALKAAAMLAKDDPRRAFDTLSTAVKYANSLNSKVEQSSNALGRAVRLEASIGNMRLMLAHGPETLSEVQIDPALLSLAKSDWFRSQYVANDFREPALRLSLKLRFAEAVLSGDPTKRKPTQKASVQKPSPQ